MIATRYFQKQLPILITKRYRFSVQKDGTTYSNHKFTKQNVLRVSSRGLLSSDINVR